MVIKGVKPRTHLMIDFLLFVLLGMVVFTAIMDEHSASQGTSHLQFMVHRIHGVAGVAMCLTLGLHLYLHLPWIWSQCTRLFKGQV